MQIPKPKVVIETSKVSNRNMHCRHYCLKVFYSLSDGNKAAHVIARECFDTKRSSSWEVDPPSFFRNFDKQCNYCLISIKHRGRMESYCFSKKPIWDSKFDLSLTSFDQNLNPVKFWIASESPGYFLFKCN
jgi:hypothetical protein